jgi:hypothetical protein
MSVEPATRYVLSIIALLHATDVSLFVNEAGVVEAARTYGRQLLLSTETLAAAASATTAKKPTKKAPPVGALS